MACAKIHGLVHMVSSATGHATTLSAGEVLAAYDRVSALYPFVPPLSLWRAWECAAYARFPLEEPVLDVGCGDGSFFRFLWPGVRQVVGVDQDPAVVACAEASGVYERVLHTPAHLLDEEARYASAFANCSLEHMDELSEVLLRVNRALRRGGTLLCSVVTDRFVSWATLPAVLESLAAPDLASRARQDYLDRHHLVNPLGIDGWRSAFTTAGFAVREQIPIVPEMSARVFLTLDTAWHLRDPEGQEGTEMAARLERFLSRRPRFPAAFRSVLAGLLEMELAPEPACGVVFLVERPRG